MNNFIALRAIANRLNSTPIDELPYQVGYLASSIASCKDVLQTPPTGNDHSLLLHKLKTRVSALLQDRTSEGRFAGMVMARALVESGRTALLSDCGSWARNLISCLNKPDTWEVKRVCVVTISRIYILAVNDPILVREIVTPTLPAFISATLNIIKPTTSIVNDKTIRALSPLLEVVLHTWHTLLERFASTFRPNMGSLKSVCLSLITDDDCPKSVRSAAKRVIARLHFCAPKNNVAAEWAQTCSQAIEAAHDTADLVFRAIVEDWKPISPRTSKVTKKQRIASVPATTTNDVFGIESWSGVSQGCSRLVSYISTLKDLLTSHHAQEVSVAFGALFDLTSRIAAVTLPTAKFALRINNEVTRDEREELWLNMPRVHATLLWLYRDMASSFGQALFPVSNAIAVQMWDVFDAEQDNEAIRTATNELVTTLMSHQLLNVSKTDSTNIRRLIEHCCDDLKAQHGEHFRSADATTNGTSSTNKANSGKALTLTPVQPKASHVPNSSARTALHSSAHRLLPAILMYAPLHVLSGHPSLRTQIDQTAILVQHRDAILASVMYPARSRIDSKTGQVAAARPSLLPFYSQCSDSNGNSSMACIHKLAEDALLRPRMPIIRSKSAIATAEQESEDEMERTVVTSTYKFGTSDGHSEEGFAGSHDDQPSGTSNVESSGPVTQSPNSRKEDEGFEPSTKRDFTTLLEQSADAQLAASAAAPSDAEIRDANDDNENDLPAAKRLQMDVDKVGRFVPQNGNDAGTSGTTAVVNNDALLSSIHNGSVSTPASDNIVHAETKGKETIGYADEESSDSDIPLIDATLVGMSDSEADEDE